MSQNQILSMCLARFLGIILLLICLTANTLAVNNRPIHVSTYLYQDATKELTLPEIQKNDSIGLFERVNHIENMGISREVSWIKIVVENAGKDSMDMILRWKEGLTHYVHFYEVGKDRIRESISGLSVDDVQKEIISNAICFPVSLNANSKHTYFLQIITPYNKEMNISVIDRKQLDKDERTYNIFAGAIIFSVLVISLYNLFLGISLKDRLYFHFVAANITDTFASTTMFGLLPTVFPFIPC